MTDGMFESPIDGLRDVYREFLVKPEWESDRHPYSFIKEYYSDTKGSRFSGLPGYSPPAHVKALLYLRDLSMFMFVVSFIGFLLKGIGIIVDATSTAQLVLPFSIPYSGTTLVSIGPFGDVIATPTFIAFVLFLASSYLYFGAHILSLKLSVPYEEEYEEWLDKIHPDYEGGYPRDLSWILRDDNDLPTAPSCAPRQFREIRLREKITTVVLAGLYIIVVLSSIHMFRLMFYNSSQMRVPQKNPANKTIKMQEKNKTVKQERRDKFE